MDRWGVEMSEQPSSKVGKDSSPCSQVLAAAEEIANAIGQLCAHVGAVVDVGAVARKTAELIEARTQHTPMRETMGHIANMPEYDQDDAHRLRNIAQVFLANSKTRKEQTL